MEKAVEYLLKRKQEAENLVGSWNGEDEKFIHEGEIFSESDVNVEQDVIKKCDELLKGFEELKALTE